MERNNLIKKGVVVAIILLFISVSVIPSTGTTFEKKSTVPISSGNIFYVGGSGPNNYTKIQDAIDNASNGDTVFVFNGTYYENVIIDASIDLIGEDRNTTVIDANYHGDVLIIKSSDVMVFGFTIKNCEDSDVVVRVHSCENVVIKNNIISIGFRDGMDWEVAIYLKGSSNNIIQNNVIVEDDFIFRSNGVWFDGSSTFNNVSGNEISSYLRGIYLSVGTTTDNTIYGNYVHNCKRGIENLGSKNKIINNVIQENDYTGIEMWGGNENTISGNIITDNGGATFDGGIILTDCFNTVVSGNIISNNTGKGIEAFAYYSNIMDNHISNNSQYGIKLLFGRNNLITRNNLIDNDENAYFEYFFPWLNMNRWNKNYWDRPRIFPKFIFGLGIPPFDIDWRPALKPYEIGV